MSRCDYMHDLHEDCFECPPDGGPINLYYFAEQDAVRRYCVDGVRQARSDGLTLYPFVPIVMNGDRASHSITGIAVTEYSDGTPA